MNTHTQENAVVNPIMETAFENHAVRVLGTPENMRFVHKDACNILGIERYRDAYAKLPEWAQGGRLWVDAPGGSGKGGSQEMATLTEAGLYYLVLRSDKPAAKRFAEWVCVDLIPSVRKKGYYFAPGTSPATLELERARMSLRAAELKLEAGRLAHTARSMQLPERPAGWITIGEYVSGDMPLSARHRLMAGLGNTLRKAPHVWVRDRYRKARKAYAPETVERAMAHLQTLPAAS